MLLVGRLKLVEVWRGSDVRLQPGKEKAFDYFGDVIRCYLGWRLAEIGRKLAGLSASSPGFLSSGETTANLNLVGKKPLLKDKLASVEMSSEKTEPHDLMREVGM